MRGTAETGAAYLEAVLTGTSIADCKKALKQITFDDLATWPDDVKTAFWLNVYNAFVVEQLRVDATLWREKRKAFFQQPLLQLANAPLSLHQIEHHILRKGKWLFGLGYLPALISPALRGLQPAVLDSRIHFALNCGAASCPPVTTYKPATLNQTLAAQTKSFLQRESVFQAEKKTLTVSRIMLWYLGDFGGMKGVKQLHRALGLIPETQVRLKFAKYDWSLSLPQ